MSEVQNLLENWILPKTIGSGCFGDNVKLKNFTIDDVSSKGDQFASEVIFAQVNIESPDGNTKTYDVVIKIQLREKEFRDLVNSTMQFQNEILMYEKILPIFNKQDIIDELFCKYYYGYTDLHDPTKDFIVVEDLRKYGYRLPKEKVFLDYEHCAISMKQLGKLHALSYIKKSRNEKELQSIVKNIQDKWTDKSLLSCQEMIQLCVKRGILPLIDNGESAELLEHLLKEYEDLITLFRKVVEPIEPEAVLCHGDFNRNNILFQYNTNQQITGVKFIDLQTPRYSSPVIDLSFFICMNMSHSLREIHLNDLLDIYKQSVQSTVYDHVDQLFNLPELHFNRCINYGYIITSFFLPIMMAEDLGIDEVLSSDPDKGICIAHLRGGNKETQALSDIIRDFIQFGYIKEVMFNDNEK